MIRLDKIAVILAGITTLMLFIGIGCEKYFLYSCTQSALKQQLSSTEIKEICK